MSPYFLFMFLLLLCSSDSVRSCLQCDLVVVSMHEDFLSKNNGLTVNDQMDLKQIIDRAYFVYGLTGKQFHGVIDATTLYRARTEYQSKFKRFWAEGRTEAVTFDMVYMVEKGRKILLKHLEMFNAQGLCPNKCGFLTQRVMNCTSCQYGLFTCQSATTPLDCEDQYLAADEGEEVLLDCLLPWHSLVAGQTEYHYSWHPGEINLTEEVEYEELVVTKDSKIVLNQLRVSEGGTYRCLLMDQKGTEVSRMHFILKVNPFPSTTPRQVVTLPTLRPYTNTLLLIRQSSLLILLTLMTGIGIIGSLTIINYLRESMEWHGEESDSRRGGEGDVMSDDCQE
ncbi:hypothetical protein DNTS_015600 [Danionella cerebrum]|uniref:Ig-like domain-containing protein n=1 Tax=Danionella cerebrum TaxID=2873325 RepID=A0A553QS85_9TELE|nr:hypothetical protein DNTS_015600 [Danionella translucida]